MVCPPSALVRVTSRDRQHTLLKRLVQLLYPLEISQSKNLDHASGGTTSAQSQPDKTPETREPVTESLETWEPVRCPVQTAAKKAAERRRSSLGQGATEPELIVRLIYNVHVVEQ